MNPRPARHTRAGRRPRASCPICCWSCSSSPPPLLRLPGAAGSRRSPRSGLPPRSRSRSPRWCAASRRRTARRAATCGCSCSPSPASTPSPPSLPPLPAGAARPSPPPPLLRLGLCGVVVVVAAARVPGWWPAPALAACAAALEAAQTVLAPEPAAPAAAWALLASVVSLALLTLASAAVFARVRRERAALAGQNRRAPARGGRGRGAARALGRPPRSRRCATSRRRGVGPARRARSSTSIGTSTASSTSPPSRSARAASRSSCSPMTARVWRSGARWRARGRSSTATPRPWSARA